MIGYLTCENRESYEKFVSNHPKGHFMQSVLWGRVKDNWINEAVISYDDKGEIRGTVNLLIRKVPFFKSTIMYAPRGPVCDICDEEVLTELIDGTRVLAKKYKSHVLKIDPDVIDARSMDIKDAEPNYVLNEDTLSASEKFIGIMKKLGFSCDDNSKNFEGIQPKHVFRLDVKDKTEEEVWSVFTSDARNRINYAKNHGVDVRLGTRDDLKSFHEIMEITGQRDEFVVRSLEYFEKMYDALSPDNIRLYMASNEGEDIAGTLAIYYGNKVWYLYGASSNKKRKLKPNYLLQWEMIKWAIEKKCDVYDFRGVPSKEDEESPLYGLYTFKNKFRGTFTTFVGELELIYNKPLNSLVNFAEKTYRELRRKIYVLKGKKNG